MKTGQARHPNARPTCTNGPRYKAIALSLALLGSLAVGAPSLTHAADIAVIDLQGAVMQTEDGIRAQATLKKLFDKRQQELDSKQELMGRMKSDIEKQSRILSREALARRMELWQREMLQLQTVFVDYNKELGKKQSELTQPIVKRLAGIIARLAKQNGYSVVIDKAAAPYVRSDLDLTERVIQMYNSGESADSDAKAPDPQPGEPKNAP